VESQGQHLPGVCRAHDGTSELSKAQGKIASLHKKLQAAEVEVDLEALSIEDSEEPPPPQYSKTITTVRMTVYSMPQSLSSNWEWQTSRTTYCI